MRILYRKLFSTFQTKFCVNLPACLPLVTYYGKDRPAGIMSYGFISTSKAQLNCTHFLCEIVAHAAGNACKAPARYCSFSFTTSFNLQIN